jgi:cell division protein FtsB
LSKLINGLLICLLIYIQYGLWAGKSSLGKYFELRQEVSEQREENELQRARNNILYAEIDDLRNGIEATEERARNDLGMIREGEVFYRVVD